MPCTRLRRLATAGAWALAASAGLSPSPTLADRPPPTQAIAGPSSVEVEGDVGRRPVTRRAEDRRGPGASAEGSGGWWLGTAGIAAALAVVGGVSLASRRFLPSRDSGPLQVVGRAGLSPKQSVYLLRVGDRVLILGAGPQGPPAALGEVTDPAELARLAPRRAPGTGPDAPTPRATPGFDRRIGDPE